MERCSGGQSVFEKRLENPLSYRTLGCLYKVLLCSCCAAHQRGEAEVLAEIAKASGAAQPVRPPKSQNGHTFATLREGLRRFPS